ncbi:MAG: M1 family aminopeptidase [Alphaproteobacteria bacterium]
MSELKVMRLEDYRPPEFTTAHVEMNIDIHPEHSIVSSRVKYNRTVEGQGVAQLVLNAENPNGDDAQTGEKRPFIRSVKLNGTVLESSQYVVDGENHQLIIPVSADIPTAVVEIENILLPKVNTDLTGLYDSDGILVTQCEPESFRRIMPFLDRPDVMPSFAVRLEAPLDVYPVLLANGNKIGEGENADLDVYPVLLANGNKIGEGENADNGRHWARFEDPFPKPCYLFAAAGGNFEALSEVYTTQTGRNITLNIFTELGRSQFAGRAMESLKKMLAFDERVFGAEYRLDVYNILSVSKFTFGAMENRGLNVFKSKYVEADRATATDMDFMLVDRFYLWRDGKSWPECIQE